MNKVLTVPPQKKGLHDITDLVKNSIDFEAVGNGLVTLFVQHTSASLIIQENADPAVLRDLETWIDKVAPESPDYRHQEEGPDDMPAHIKGAITNSHVSVPIINGNLALGVWQGIFLWEHRNQPRARQIVIHVA